MKLPNIFSSFQLNQSPHGVYQGFKAIDVAKCDLIAPFDGCRVINIDGTGTARYFDLKLPNGSIIQCVHGIPTKPLGSTFNKGEIFGKCVWHHWHIAILVKGVWYNILDFIERNFVIKLMPGFKSQHWANWSTYADRHLDIERLINDTKNRDVEVFLKGNEKRYVVKKGGWRSNVIEEIIDAGLWSGTWQDNEARFLKLEPKTPQGGWKPGDSVVYDIITDDEPNIELQTNNEEVKEAIDPYEIQKDKFILETQGIETDDTSRVTMAIRELYQKIAFLEKQNEAAYPVEFEGFEAAYPVEFEGFKNQSGGNQDNNSVTTATIANVVDSVKDKWSTNKFFVGGAKNGTLYSILGGMVVFAMQLAKIKWPELSDSIDSISILAGLGAGVGTVSNAVNNVKE